MADVSSALAEAIAKALGGDRGHFGSRNPTSSVTKIPKPPVSTTQPFETTLQAAAAASAAKASQGQENAGLGRFYVIRASEDQPAPAAGHFVKIISGPHNGYDAAVASVKGSRGLASDTRGPSGVNDWQGAF
jgi:hypothetical protein